MSAPRSGRAAPWRSARQLAALRHFLTRPADAARLALNAGVDMEMTSTDLAEHGKKLVRSGRIDPGRLDDAVARILRLKFALGLFENPYVDEDDAVTEPTPAARKAAREAAARSMVLLRNDKQTLPLKRTVPAIAVVGPLADSKNTLGAGTFPFTAKPAHTILDGIRAAAPGARVTHAEGVDTEGKDTGGIPEAVSAAKAADFTVVVVGEPSSMSGEAASRSDITLPGAQEELIGAIAETGKPFASSC